MACFEEIPRWHDPTKDFELHLKPSSSQKRSSRDWIGLFPVGWKSLKDYAAYVWVRTYSVLYFVASAFPRIENAPTASFQFVYVTSSGEVLDATPPFQFLSNDCEPESTDSFVYVKKDKHTGPDEILLESRGVGTSICAEESVWKRAFENEKRITQRQEVKYVKLQTKNESLRQRVDDLEREVARLRSSVVEKPRDVSLTGQRIVKPPPPPPPRESSESSLFDYEEQPIVYPPAYQPPGLSIVPNALPVHDSLQLFDCPMCKEPFSRSMGRKSFLQHVEAHFHESD